MFGKWISLVCCGKKKKNKKIRGGKTIEQLKSLPQLHQVFIYLFFFFLGEAREYRISHIEPKQRHSKSIAKRRRRLLGGVSAWASAH